MKKQISKLEAVLILALCAFLIVPNQAYAAWSENIAHRETSRMLAEDDRLIDLYVTEKNGIPYFDVEAAKKHGENKEAIEMGELFNDYSQAMNDPHGDAPELRGLTLPIWGNWCGPGYGSGVPIDILDEGCKKHDGCYKPFGGKKNCGCNRILINHINRNFHRMTKGQQTAAKAVRGYFAFENKVCGC